MSESYNGSCKYLQRRCSSDWIIIDCSDVFMPRWWDAECKDALRG